MGQITLYDPGGNARVEPLPSVRVAQTVTPGVSNFGQALGDVAQTVDKIGLEYDVVRAKEVDSEFRNKALELGMGPNGYFGKKARDAAEGYEEYRQNLRKLYDDTISGVQGRRARELVSDSLRLTVAQEESRAATHFRQQLDAYHDTVDAKSIASRKNEAAANFSDSDLLMRNLEAIAAVVRARAKRNGIDSARSVEEAEAVEAEIREQQSELVAMAANTAAQYGSDAMYAVMRKFGSVLDAKTRSDLTEKLASATVRDMAVDLSDKLFDASSILGEMYSRADEIEPPALRKEVRSMISARWRQARQVEAAQQR